MPRSIRRQGLTKRFFGKVRQQRGEVPPVQLGVPGDPHRFPDPPGELGLPLVRDGSAIASALLPEAPRLCLHPDGSFDGNGRPVAELRDTPLLAAGLAVLLVPEWPYR